MADTKSKEREETPNAVIKRAKKFLQEGCGCSRGSKGGPCSREFREKPVLFNLNNGLKLTRGELNLIILANIQAFTRNDGIGTKRSGTSRCTYQFQSVQFAKRGFFTFMVLVTVIPDYVDSRNITRSMVSIREPMATPKGFPVTPFPSQPQRKSIIF